MTWKRAKIHLPQIMLATALGWMVLVHMDFPVMPYDDAFITFRYVENFLGGQGLVYNQGERVLGFTSPLYLFWLAALKTVFPHWSVPYLAVRFNAVPFGMTAMALYFLLQRVTQNRNISVLGALAFLLNPVFLAISGGAMESFLFSAVLLLTLLSMAVNKPLLTGLFGGLSVLARPEGVFLLPFMAGPFFFRPKELLKVLVSFGVVFLPWLIFSWVYFGSPIPLPILAKAKPLYPLPFGFALRQIQVSLESLFMIKAVISGAWVRTVLIWGLLAAASLTLLGTSREGLRSHRAGVLLFWTLILAYGVGNPFFFYWYWPNVSVLAMVILFSGWYFWVRNGVRSSNLLKKLAGRIFWGAGLSWLAIATCLPYFIIGLKAPVQIAYNIPSTWRIIAYMKAADFLNRKAAPQDKVAAAEIGALGYYYHGYVYDPCGLVSPEAHAFLPVPASQRLGPDYGAISADFIKQVKPEWVVTMPVFAVKSLSQSDWFTSQYALLEEFSLPVPVWGDRAVQVYRKIGRGQPRHSS